MHKNLIWAILFVMTSVSCAKTAKVESKQPVKVAEDQSDMTVNQDSKRQLDREKVFNYGSEEEKLKLMADENNPYLLIMTKIPEIMIDGKIPESFPKNEQNLDQKAYMNQVNQWIKENPELVKPGSRNGF
jgi:hypothetical protein